MIEIPDKSYFKIGEVARILGVKPSVLRYWETEFRSIRPEKTRSNQRVYSRRDVERLREIRTLLYDQKYTIAGARRRLREEAPEGEAAREGASRQRAVFALVKKEVEELLRLVDE